MGMLPDPSNVLKKLGKGEDMLNRAKALNSVLIILLLSILISCASAPKGYVNKDKYLYVDGDKEEVAIAFTEDLFCELYGLPECPNKPVKFSITQLDYQHAGWNGVKFMELRPGTHHFYLGQVGKGAYGSSIIEPYKVYIFIWEEDHINQNDTIYSKAIGGAEYIPGRKSFVYQGREYKVP